MRQLPPRPEPRRRQRSRAGARPLSDAPRDASGGRRARGGAVEGRHGAPRRRRWTRSRTAAPPPPRRGESTPRSPGRPPSLAPARPRRRHERLPGDLQSAGRGLPPPRREGRPRVSGRRRARRSAARLRLGRRGRAAIPARVRCGHGPTAAARLPPRPRRPAAAARPLRQPPGRAVRRECALSFRRLHAPRREARDHDVPPQPRRRASGHGAAMPRCGGYARRGGDSAAPGAPASSASGAAPRSSR